MKNVIKNLKINYNEVLISGFNQLPQKFRTFLIIAKFTKA